MTITAAQVDLWRQAASETQRLEFKEAKNSFNIDKLNEYSVALANEGGGHLVLGVADKPPRPVVGTQAFPNLIETTERLFQAVGFRVDLEEVHHPDGRVLVFTIPPRPSGSAYHLKGQYLMRSGASLTPMSEDRLRAIFAEGAPDWLEQHSLTGLDDQQVIDLLDTQTFFELIKLPYPTDRNAVLGRLKDERLIDTLPGGIAIRRLGGLLFAKRLDEFPDLARKAARLIVYDGTSKLKTRSDQVESRGYAVGFQSLVASVMAQLPQNEIIQDALRTSVKLLPEDAVRELVANALIHQDLTISGMGPEIEIYSDRMVISNPGEPVVPVERFIDGYQSRNERLADLMRRMGICEEKSSGIDRVIAHVEAYQLPAPDFRAGFKRTVVTVFGPRSFDAMDREDRIRACYHHCVLKYVMGERMTNQSLRERFKLPVSKTSVTSQVIAAATEANLVKLDQAVGGSRKYARYLPFWA